MEIELEDKLGSFVIDFFKTNIGNIKDGSMVKGKFLGQYMSGLKQIDAAMKIGGKYKVPQVIDDRGGSNSWLDYILGLTDDEYGYFIESLNS